MSQFHNIFCDASASLTRAELADFASDSWYGDDDLGFSPAEGSSSADDVDWDTFSITLPGSRRPINITRSVDSNTISTLAEEVVEEFGEELPQGIADRVNRARLVIGIELFPDHMDDDAWEMLDQVQSFISRRLDGLIVTDDGIYDQDLNSLLRTDGKEN